MIDYVKMDETHVREVAQLEALCFSEPWSENSVASELSNPLSLWIVAIVDGEVVGYVGSQTVLNEADMMNLAVQPQHRRQGIAEGLVQKLISALKDRQAVSLTLEVRVSNEAAITLYQKIGFSQVGRRPSYYRKPKEDALILRKEW